MPNQGYLTVYDENQNRIHAKISEQTIAGIIRIYHAEVVNNAPDIETLMQTRPEEISTMILNKLKKLYYESQQKIRKST